MKNQVMVLKSALSTTILVKVFSWKQQKVTLEDCTRKRIFWKLIVFIYSQLENLKHQLRKPEETMKAYTAGIRVGIHST